MEKNEISIGRSRLNDLVIDHKEVSNFHSKLDFLPDGTLWIYDMDSTNGVFVNGERIKGKSKVMPNDIIKLGSYPFDWQQAILVSSKGEHVEQMSSTALGENIKRPSYSRWILIGLFVFIGVILIYATGILEKSKGFVSEVTKSWTLKNNPIVYDISCLVDESTGGNLIKVIGDAKKDILGIDKVVIEIKEEEEVGLEVKKMIDEEYQYSQDLKYTDRIGKIFSNLISKMDNPKFEYQYYVVESDEINAITAGGQIFVFTGIIDFAANDDELASILAHEIYHNELGHIGDQLKEIKIAQNWLGDGLGDLAYYVTSIFSVSFNQENEVYSDLYGLDLAVKAGYNGCAGINFWERMQETDSLESSTVVDKFFRFHPFSHERVSCNRKHIDFNYYHRCD